MYVHRLAIGNIFSYFKESNENLRREWRWKFKIKRFSGFGNYKEFIM